MKKITVNTKTPYEILIGQNLLDTLGEEIRQLDGICVICVVSDSNVWPLYGEAVSASLIRAGYSVIRFVFPAGEEQKNAETYLRLLHCLAENKLTRSDILVALGGGVVGDLAGFAAATYLRGIRYVQIPTSLLAAVDSSVGGKTAIDLPAGKNLAGAFWQPSLVICDTATLDTLPQADFRAGCGEVIKYGILYDPQLFSVLEKNGLSFDREWVISRCVALKRDVVTEDEYDTGLRMKLNLGHTVGHSIEALSHFSVPHGEAVAAGMAVVCRASGCADTWRILALLETFGLPTETSFSAQQLCDYALSDKKRSSDSIKMIIPVSIGNCEIRCVPTRDLKSFIQAGL